MLLKIAATWFGALLGAGIADDKAAPRPDVTEPLAPTGAKASFTSADSKGALYAAGEPYRFVLELDATLGQRVTTMVRALTSGEAAVVRMDVYGQRADGRWQRVLTRTGSGTVASVDAGADDLSPCAYQRLRVAGSACRTASGDETYEDLPVRVGAFNLNEP
jgi:hypothetical protein